MRNMFEKNKTALVGVAVVFVLFVVACCGLGSIASKTKPTPTPTVTNTVTATVTSTPTAIATATSTPTSSPTVTSTVTAVATATATNTAVIIPTQKPVETAKPVKPTNVPTVRVESPTMVPVQPTEVPTVAPTAIPEPTAMPEPTAVPTVNFDRDGSGTVTCDDFDNRREAKKALDAGHKNLDRNKDGIPCEDLPE